MLQYVQFWREDEEKRRQEAIAQRSAEETTRALLEEISRVDCAKCEGKCQYPELFLGETNGKRQALCHLTYHCPDPRARSFVVCGSCFKVEGAGDAKESSKAAYRTMGLTPHRPDC